MRAVAYSPAAQADLHSITIYIAEDNPDRAISFVDELRAVAQSVAERPASFPERADVARGLRAARHGRYLIFFTHAPLGQRWRNASRTSFTKLLKYRLWDLALKKCGAK